MTPEQFAYWLQGYFEIRAATTQNMAIDALQATVIKNHLDSVFEKKIAHFPLPLKKEDSHDKYVFEYLYPRETPPITPKSVEDLVKNIPIC